MHARLLASILTVLLLAAAPASLTAQVSAETRAASIAINSFLGAATAGVRQIICGCYRWRGLARGAAGGAVMSIGKQVTGAGFDGSGLLGRQVHALGISLVVSADQPRPLLLFPVGPLTLELRPGAVNRLHARLDLTDLAILLHTASASQTRVDWVASLSTGAPVLIRPRERMPLGYDADGFAFIGNIFLAMELSPVDRRELRAHEAIHVLQWDALRHLAAHPAERAAVRVVSGTQGITRHIDLGALGPGVMFVFGPILPYEQRPWEKEGHLLTTGRF